MLLFSHASSVVHSLKLVKKIRGTRRQQLLYVIRTVRLFECCHLLELYGKGAALYRTFIQSRSGIRDVVVREGENSI